MIEDLVQYIRKNFPNFYAMLKGNPILRYIYFFPSKMYMQRRREAIQNYGYEVVEMVYWISKKLNLGIWIDAGTLLGYVREGKLLQHDYDIDFGTYSLNKTDRDALIKELEKNGCSFVRGVFNGKILYSDSFEYKGVIFDLSYYFIENGVSFYYEQDANEDHGTKVVLDNSKEYKVTYMQGHDLYKYKIIDSGIEDGTFLNGCPCVVPKDAVRRVEEIYGVDWEIPIIQDYNWRRDTLVEYLGFHKEVIGWKIK